MESKLDDLNADTERSTEQGQQMGFAAPAEETVKRLGEVARELRRVKVERDALEAQDKKLKEQYGHLADEFLNLTQTANLDAISLDDCKVSVKPELRGTIIEGEGAKFLKYLLETGNEGVAKVKVDPVAIPKAWLKKLLQDGDRTGALDVSVPWNTLAAMLKNTCDVLDEKTWPPGIKLTTWNAVTVRFKR